MEAVFEVREGDFVGPGEQVPVFDLPFGTFRGSGDLEVPEPAEVVVGVEAAVCAEVAPRGESSLQAALALLLVLV